jgi:hypothetical protein
MPGRRSAKSFGEPQQALGEEKHLVIPAGVAPAGIQAALPARRFSFPEGSLDSRFRGNDTQEECLYSSNTRESAHIDLRPLAAAICFLASLHCNRAICCNKF